MESFSKIMNKFKSLNGRRKMITLYFSITSLGIALFVLSFVFPKFEYCLNLFGNRTCSPLGLMMLMLVNIPGYIFTGNILPFTTNWPWLLSLITVLFFSFMFYFTLGWLWDRFLQNGRKISADSFAVITFIILIIIVIILL